MNINATAGQAWGIGMNERKSLLPAGITVGQVRFRDNLAPFMG